MSAFSLTLFKTGPGMLNVERQVIEGQGVLEEPLFRHMEVLVCGSVHSKDLLAVH